MSTRTPENNPEIIGTIAILIGSFEGRITKVGPYGFILSAEHKSGPTLFFKPKNNFTKILNRAYFSAHPLYIPIISKFSQKTKEPSKTVS